MPSLDREIARLRERQARFDALAVGADAVARTRPYISSFAKCCRQVAAAYGACLPEALEQINLVRTRHLASAAAHSSNLQRSTHILTTIFGSAIHWANRVPLEFVEYVRSLFERTDLAQKQFVIAVDPRLAVITLRQLAEQYGIRESAPAFYAVFEDSAAGDFPVLLCPESLLGRGRCLDWVLVAHEIGHVVAEATQIVDAHYPSAPTDLKALRKWAAEGDQQSTSAMHLVEYACDEVGTRLGGAAFVWRLFTDVFSIDGMSRADTHPPIHKRIERAIATSRLLGFGDEASELEQMLRGEASGVDYGVITSDVPAEVLSQVTAQLERATRAITKSHVESACKLHSLALTLDLVRARLLAGIPTALDANTIFAATTLSEDIHNSEPLQEVVADSIRLGQMRVRFGEIMSAGHT